MNAIFQHFLRISIAILFILSGFVKAIDLVGFSFKMEEYFSPTVFNLPFLEKYALLFSFIVVVIELFLGILLLLSIKTRKVVFLLIFLCLFFGFLTFYSAYYNVVTDCGCFGDAIKFTPWESFTKDLILLFGLLLLLVFMRNSKENGQQRPMSTIKNLFLVIFSVIMVWVMYQGVNQEPIIDFRDYKVGTNLNIEKKKIAENPSIYKALYTLKNTKTNEVIKVNQDEYVNNAKYWEEGTVWQQEKGKNESVLVKQGYVSEISKFNLESSTGENLTEEILKMPKVVLLFSYAPEKVDPILLSKIEQKLLSQKKIPIFGVSTQPNLFTKIPNLMMDGTAIKTIARSNPFILVLKKGVIIEKFPAKNEWK